MVFLRYWDPDAWFESCLNAGITDACFSYEMIRNTQAMEAWLTYNYESLRFTRFGDKCRYWYSDQKHNLAEIDSAEMSKRLPAHLWPETHIHQFVSNQDQLF